MNFIWSLCCCIGRASDVSNSNNPLILPMNMPATDQTAANLADASWKTTIPFIPPVTCGKVIKVYDGDTITIATRLPFPNSPVYRFPVRLLGIDSAEIKGKTFEEKACAVAARDALSAKIFGEIVVLKNVSMEKYGRILADVYLGNLHLNQWMLDQKLAVEYDGGTKHKPAEWETILITK